MVSLADLLPPAKGILPYYMLFVSLVSLVITPHAQHREANTVLPAALPPSHWQLGPELPDPPLLAPRLQWQIRQEPRPPSSLRKVQPRGLGQEVRPRARRRKGVRDPGSGHAARRPLLRHLDSVDECRPSLLRLPPALRAHVRPRHLDICHCPGSLCERAVRFQEHDFWRSSGVPLHAGYCCPDMDAPGSQLLRRGPLSRT